MESNQDGSGITTFTVEPADGGESAQVTIATDLMSRPGMAGYIERVLASWMFPRVYQKELAQLSEYLARQA
jgi:hypothetical protein